MSNKDFGRALWTVIHTVAAGYPVTPAMSRADRDAWVARYLDFFNSLYHVLPDPAWRETLMYAMPPLTEMDMHTLNEHKEPRKVLSRTWFRAHDAVRRRLGQTVQGASAYASLFAKYSGQQRHNNTKNASARTDPAGIRLMTTLLPTRTAAMDAFLTQRLQGYATMREHKKASLRLAYLQDAAAWWWAKLVTPYAQEAPSRRRQLVEAVFKQQFPRITDMAGNTYKNLVTRLGLGPSR